MSEIALKLIKEAKEKRLTRLDLRWCGLTDWTEELFELVWLEELLLSDDDFPYEYDDWGNPIVFDNDRKYCSNDLKSINFRIRNLKGLKKLTIAGHGDSEIGWEINDLSPLRDLTNLEELDISNTQVSSLLPIKNLINLKSLYISNTKVKDLSPIQNLTNLQELSILFTPITDLDPIKKMTNLRSLFAREVRISSLNPLKNLVNLEILELNHTSIFDLTPLRNLKKIKILEISGTYVDEIDPLENLINIEELVLSFTEISDLAPIKKLTKIEILELEGTQITDLAPLQNLTKLSLLSFSGTQVSDLAPLSKLINLEVLYCTDNQIQDVTPLVNLPNLLRLNIDNNPVNDLSPLRKLLEKGIPSSVFIEGISFFNCPLINPPIHIAEQGSEAILRYWQELEDKEAITNNQTKLIFVGNSRAGKTSLWQFLKDKIYNQQTHSTHGIKTEIWDSEPLGTESNQNLAAHIWDFGGQEYYHATHRLFLADNAVYVLVWEKDSNKQGTRLEKLKLDDDPNGEVEEMELEYFPASYWLENIQYFAGNNCPILIVQNKVDEEVQKANYTEGLHETLNCFHVSVQNAFGFQQGNLILKRYNLRFQDFKECLLELLRKNATSFPLLKYYGEVRKRLEKLAKQNEFLTIEDLEKIAFEEDETKTPDLQNLLAYLKSFTNTVLYFPQNEVLKDRLYLNPTHISRDIYKILNKIVRKNNGKFDITHIQKRLNCDASEAERFAALMTEFDLIFEKSKTKGCGNFRQFVTPQYLPKYGDLDDTIRFLIEGYDFKTSFFIKFKSFVPRSLMLRFIAQNGAYANQETYWKNGIIYKSAFSQKMLQVEYDHEKSTFSVSIQGKEAQKIDMQNIVQQFVKLNDSDDKIEISNDGNAYFELKKIYMAHSQNRKEIDNFEGEYTPLSNFDWLTQKYKTKEFMTIGELKNKVRALISKAKTKEAMEEIAKWADENNKEQLKTEIAVLQRSLADVQRQFYLGTLTYSEFSRENAKLIMAAMSLLDTLEEAQNSGSERFGGAEIKEPKPNENADTKTKILMLTANTSKATELNLGKEHSQIVQKLERKQDVFNLNLKGSINETEFKEHTETIKPDILHFSGHAEGGGKYGGLIVHNEQKNGEEYITPDKLDVLFDYFQEEGMKFKAVILNACYSQEQAEVIAKYVPYVIATTVAIGDTMAIKFSAGFYFKLVEANLDFEKAYKSGIASAISSTSQKSFFVLYKDGKKIEL